MKNFSICLLLILTMMTPVFIYINNPYLFLSKQASLDRDDRMNQIKVYCASRKQIIDDKSIIDDPQNHWTAASCYNIIGPDAYEEDPTSFKTFASPGYRGQFDYYTPACSKGCKH